MQTSGVIKSTQDETKVAYEDTEVYRRWYLWDRLVVAGRKKNFQGAPAEVITKASRAYGDESKLVTDVSERNGFLNRVARRRAKNGVAKRSRKVNR